MMLVAESCIVADPPEYRAPGQTRPVLNVYSAVPTATWALVVFPGMKTPFTVQVRSEDAGEDLRAIFFLDYQLPGESKLISKSITASTYDNTGRNITYDWFPQKDKTGCHYVSLVVAHRNSFKQQEDDDHLRPEAAAEDAAIVTWTVNINPQGDPNTLNNCPSGPAALP